MLRDENGEPLVCFECGTPAEHRHHVIPRSRGGTQMVPLCHDCHDRVHRRTDDAGSLIREGRLRLATPDSTGKQATQTSSATSEMATLIPVAPKRPKGFPKSAWERLSLERQQAEAEGARLAAENPEEYERSLAAKMRAIDRGY